MSVTYRVIKIIEGTYQMIMGLESWILLIACLSLFTVVITSLITWYLIRWSDMNNSYSKLGIELLSRSHQHEKAIVYITATEKLPIDLKIKITSSNEEVVHSYTFQKSDIWGEDQTNTRYVMFNNPKNNKTLLVEVDAFYGFWFHQYESFNWDGKKWVSRDIWGYYVDGWRKIFIPNHPLKKKNHF